MKKMNESINGGRINEECRRINDTLEVCSCACANTACLAGGHLRNMAVRRAASACDMRSSWYAVNKTRMADRLPAHAASSITKIKTKKK